MNRFLITFFAISSCFTASAMKINQEELDKQFISAAGGGNLEKVKDCIAAGADVHATTWMGRTALMNAAWHNCKNVVTHLIACGAEVNQKEAEKVDPDAVIHKKEVSKDGWTALIFAANEGYKEVVECLIQAGADVNVHNGTGWFALKMAAWNGRKDVVELLIQAGADVNAKDERGLTALMNACQKDRTAVVECLLKAGAEVNAKSNDGSTALMDVAYCGQRSCFELLLQYGADYTLKNNDDKDVLQKLSELSVQYRRNTHYAPIIETLSDPAKISNLVSKRFVKEHKTNTVCEALLNRELGYKK